ncbi:MAG: type ISP restriction/modification enzyme, partial [Chitinophagales bacterium]
MQGKQVEQEVHRVQMLDPATGTGTYIAEVIKQIYKKFEGQEGIWSNYVENHLLPRLIGFELLMASYAMAHLQIDLLLKETGYKPTREQRLKIYLTNSLEEHHPDTGSLFANWLSSEANEANYIKRDAPVMIVKGNPPYSGISSNNGQWISKLIDDYKYVDGVHFNERKHWLNDDYVKFIRYGQHFIEKNGCGVLAFINPHGFLDNPTFRGMRWHLLKTFDKIYTIDLHGNSKKKETAPDGSADVNVFDIQQGVSINIFVKTGKKKANELGKVFHYDLFGKREMKYDFLSENSLKTIDFKELAYTAPNYFFVPKNDDGRKLYEEGIRVDELFSKNVTGIVTMGDEFAFAVTKLDVKIRLNEFKNNNLSESELKTKYNLGKNYAEFILSNKEKLVVDDENIIECSYRPFDNRFTYFDNKILWRWRVDVMKHFIKGKNVGLITNRQCRTESFQHTFITNIINDFHITETANANPYTFPLYLYPETNAQQTIGQTTERTPNLHAEIVQQIADKLGLTFTNEKETTKDTFAPIDILDYIYAVLHSPTYREKYKEF